MKAKRHAKILELIGQYAVNTQEELLGLLQKEGFEVTQATISRDIKELRLVKSCQDGEDAEGKLKGETLAENADADDSKQ